MGGRELLADALKNFMFSLSQGASAQSQFPGARGARAGMGAALAAPFQLQELQRKQKLEEEDRAMRVRMFQEQLKQGQIDNAFKLLQARTGQPATQVPVSFEAQGDIPAMQSSYPQPQEPVQIPGMGSVRPPSAEDIIAQALAKARGEAQIQADFAPPPAPRNIDPLSDQGIAAAVKKEQQVQALQPKPQLIPGRDIPLPKDVEAQRTRMNASRAEQAGLSPQQFTQTQVLARQFDSQPIVKNFNETANRYATVKAIMDRGLGGPGDLAVVYQFMKGLDPTSVVRETEFDAAAKSGNIFAGAYTKFNGYLKPEGGFLPDNVKKSFLEILRSKADVDNRQIKKLYEDYARRIDAITRQPGTGAMYLTDYTTLLGEESTKATTGATFGKPKPK